MKTARKLAPWGTAAALATAALLSACGGDDFNNTAPPVTSEVPASASQSVDGFIAYLKQLVVVMDDTLEPVDTSSVTAPTDDTAEPQPIN